MYQWRKFEFFEDKLGGKITIPDEVTGKLECCSSGRGKIAVGCDDGTVSLLDRGFKFSYGFQAHTSSVVYLHHLKQRNFLVTVGEDEEISLQKLSFVLKVFDLDKTLLPEGPSTSSPECIQILRIFTDDFPEAKITSFSVLEEAPPILLIAFGLDNGCIYYIRGDIARKQIKRFKLQVENTSDKSQLPVTGLAFRVDGQTLQLFAVSPTSVSLFNFKTQPPSGQTLDNIGCNVSSVAMSDRLELIMGRPEAVYFYEVDGRGPCWAFEGEKKFVGWFRGYLLCIVEDQRTGQNIFNVYDLKNRLIAHSISVKEVSHMLCEWGMSNKSGPVPPFLQLKGKKGAAAKKDLSLKTPPTKSTTPLKIVSDLPVQPNVASDVAQNSPDQIPLKRPRVDGQKDGSSRPPSGIVPGTASQHLFAFLETKYSEEAETSNWWKAATPEENAVAVTKCLAEAFIHQAAHTRDFARLENKVKVLEFQKVEDKRSLEETYKKQLSYDTANLCTDLKKARQEKNEFEKSLLDLRKSSKEASKKKDEEIEKLKNSLAAAQASIDNAESIFLAKGQVTFMKEFIRTIPDFDWDQLGPGNADFAETLKKQIVEEDAEEERLAEEARVTEEARLAEEAKKANQDKNAP